MTLRTTILTLALTLASISSVSAQNLFPQFEGKTLILKGKGLSSGRAFTIREKIEPCNISETGLCLGQSPIFAAGYALKFANENIREQIQLFADDGKLAARMDYVRPGGEVEGSVPLIIRVRK